ncbi:hypothetical protein [Embleya sp. NPDC020886]|uniref:Imm32 family immunity protein n=1 Tax=Embleya sp. NPDC020886 TaxID=3363980 RepID=UPI0037B3991C
MIVVSDPNFDEVVLTGSVDDLTGLADMVARGKGFLGSSLAAPQDGDSLAGVEVADVSRPGVYVRLDAPRGILVIDGDPAARALFSAQLHSMTAAMTAVDGGGHRHIDHFPGHPYLVEGSHPLVIGIDRNEPTR